MRLDQLINNFSTELTPEKYDSLKAQKVFLFVYNSQTGWDFSDLEMLREEDARGLLISLYKAQRYEKENNLRAPIREIILSSPKGIPPKDIDESKGGVIVDKGPDPQWPKELQGNSATYMFEAFLLQKFNLTKTDLT